MKYLYLVRHAKSSWDFPELSDFERPLNKRGRRDAPVMAMRLASKQPDLDVIISSPANRALTTAKEMARALEIEPTQLIEDEEIYHASMKTLLDKVRGLSEDYQRVMLVGHNPGFTDLANQLKEHDYHIDNVPTTGVVAIELPTHKWADVEDHSGRLLFFDYPKKVL